MSGSLFTVAGVDRRPGAQTVFVWRRIEEEPKFTLLGSGSVTQTQDAEAPAGTFNVAIMLPLGVGANEVVATDNLSSEEFITEFSLTPGASVRRREPVVRTSLSGG
jgi:hypothetical protein